MARRLTPALVALLALLSAGAWGGVRAAAAAATFSPPPSPRLFVTDDAGFLSPGARQELETRLETYQTTTGHQVLVWIGQSTGDVPLEDFTVKAFAAWRVGRKGIDDGLAIFVFAADRKVRLEVGYGLEGKIPDAVASRIINEVVVPRLKAGDRDGAVAGGAEAAIGILDGKPLSSIEDMAAAAPKSQYPGPEAGAPPAPPDLAQPAVPDFWHTTFGIILKWLIIAAVLLFVITHPGLALWMLLNIFSGSSGGGGGGGGGGFSGGGGRSGGGGASGSW